MKDATAALLSVVRNYARSPQPANVDSESGLKETHKAPRLITPTSPSLSLLLTGRHHMISQGKKARTRSARPEYTILSLAYGFNESNGPKPLMVLKRSGNNEPARAIAKSTLNLSSKQVPSISGLQVFSMGRQLMRIKATAMASMALRLMIMPTIVLLIHSVHPEEDILRRDKANDTLDHTEAVIVRAAEMKPKSSTALSSLLSRNCAWRPSPCGTAAVKHAHAIPRHTYKVDNIST